MAEQKENQFSGMTREEIILEAKKQSAGTVAFATMLCILSPIGLILLGAMSEVPRYGISENVAAGIGMILLLLLIAAAVAMFIISGSRTKSRYNVRYEEIRRLGLRSLVHEYYKFGEDNT